MKVALVASGDLFRQPALGHQIAHLANALHHRGAQVELLIQERGMRRPLRHTADSFDLVHAHGAAAPLALAVARAGTKRFVFTPRGPVEQLARWPQSRVTRAVIDRADMVVCGSHAQADLLCGAFSSATDRVQVVSPGVDVAAIRAARPLPWAGNLVLTVGSLERRKHFDRAIASIAALGPAYRLMVVGDGPRRHQLRAYAADLEVSSRVDFVATITEKERFRWLRTARVLVALSERPASGRKVLEALVAGTPVVASDHPVHREAASYVDEPAVTFVSAEGSPLEVADAVSRAARAQVTAAGDRVPTWEDAVDGTFSVYESLLRNGEPRPAPASRSFRKVVRHAVPVNHTSPSGNGACRPP